MGYSDDEFEDDGASPSPEPPRPRPPQGQSPTKLGVMRSPRSAPKIPVAQARETPCAMRPARGGSGRLTRRCDVVAQVNRIIQTPPTAAERIDPTAKRVVRPRSHQLGLALSLLV